MKFRIIWIDDSKIWVKSVQAEVEEAFEKYDFAPTIDWFQETETAKKLILEGYADLILVDCNLPGDSSGDEFIKSLRKNRCFAHVVFYSQDANNLQSMEGDDHFIHVVQREDMTDTLQNVADQAYSKYRHPAFMRGLLLSEFIDLENLMEDLISQCFKGESNYFMQTIIHKCGESFSLSVKLKFILRLIRESEGMDDACKKKKLLDVGFTGSAFGKHVIKKRNALAHAYPQYDPESGKISLVSASDNIDFGAAWFHDTREKIHEQKNKIRSLISLRLYEIVNP